MKNRFVAQMTGGKAVIHANTCRRAEGDAMVFEADTARDAAHAYDMVANLRARGYGYPRLCPLCTGSGAQPAEGSLPA